VRISLLSSILKDSVQLKRGVLVDVDVGLVALLSDSELSAAGMDSN